MIERKLLDTTQGVLLDASEGMMCLGDFTAYTSLSWRTSRNEKESLYMEELSGIVNRSAVKKGDNVEVNIFSGNEIQIIVRRKESFFSKERIVYESKISVARVKYRFSTEKLAAN